MGVSKKLEQHFNERESAVKSLVRSYNLSFEEVGVFGSYARGEYKFNSDIDFCIVTDTRPDRITSGSLREEAELLGADIIYVSREEFTSGDSNFLKQLRRDYRRVL